MRVTEYLIVGLIIAIGSSVATVAADWLIQGGAAAAIPWGVLAGVVIAVIIAIVQEATDMTYLVEHGEEPE